MRTSAIMLSSTAYCPNLVNHIPAQERVPFSRRVFSCSLLSGVLVGVGDMQSVQIYVVLIDLLGTAGAKQDRCTTAKCSGVGRFAPLHISEAGNDNCDE